MLVPPATRLPKSSQDRFTCSQYKMIKRGTILWWCQEQGTKTNKPHVYLYVLTHDWQAIYE